MNLPNKLTISRIVMAFVFMFFLFLKGILAKSLALGIFAAASLTDYFDGLIARKRKEVSNFGKLMDPIADKILVLSAFLAFVEMKLIPAWMVVIIIARELVITGIRLLLAAKGRVTAAEAAGKQKTVSQIFAIFFILSFLLFREIISQIYGAWNYDWEILFKRSVFWMMLVVVALTLISGISYLKRNNKLLFKK